jgi:hypothetical protein
MGFKTLGTRDTKWEPRKGLEGPFWFVDRVLYYDPKEGQYWDPTTDFYVEQSEMDLLNQRLMEVIGR